MSQSTTALRDHLVRVLDWDDAHVGFDKAVAGISFNKVGIRPDGFDHTLWQLVEHIRIAQEDILDFCVNPAYAHTMAWPADYWPKSPAPRNQEGWNESLATYARARDAMKRLVREVENLTAKVPTGNKQQTFLRAVLLSADHAAYHVGQIVAVRRALKIWPTA
jgi:DinB superfamily